jgi:hypothetical protein
MTSATAVSYRPTRLMNSSFDPAAPGYAGALNALAATGEHPINYISRHMNLNPGALGADDQLQNLRAVREGRRVFSAYELGYGTRIWIITEADRSVTTILLPEEY